MVTHFCPADRCAWPFPLTSITSRSDSLPCNISFLLCLLMYPFPCHPSLHTSVLKILRHPFACRGGREGGKNKQREVLMCCCETLQIKPKVKVTEKPPETTMTPTHTHTQTIAKTPPQIFAPQYFHPTGSQHHKQYRVRLEQHSNPKGKRDHNRRQVRLWNF